MIKSNPCKLCGSKWHTKAFCPLIPRKPIKAGKHTIKDRQENKKFRDKHLNFQSYLICALCGSWAGTAADHRIKKSVRPDLRYEDENKQILCNPCHLKKDSGHKTIYI